MINGIAFYISCLIAPFVYAAYAPKFAICYARAGARAYRNKATRERVQRNDAHYRGK